MAYTTPKYPRVMVSLALHKKLALEAAKRKVSIAGLLAMKLKELTALQAK